MKARHVKAQARFAAIFGRSAATRSASRDANATGAPSLRLVALFALATLAAVLVLGVSLASGAPPTLTIAEPTAVETTRAHVSGTVDANEEFSQWTFEVSTDGGTSWMPTSLSGFAFGPDPETVEGTLEGLTAAQPYQVRLAATNLFDASTAESEAKPFTTDPAPVTPTATVTSATSVAYTTAQIQGAVDPEGGNEESGGAYVPIHWALQLSPSGDPGTFNDAASGDLTGADAESADPIDVPALPAELTGLSPAHTYTYRLFVTYAGQTVESSTATFTTEAVAKPTVSIDPVITVTGTTAHFSGHINPNAPAGNPAAFNVFWRFRCTPECPGVEGFIGADNSSHLVEGTVEGLQPGTAYEVMLVAENAGGEASTSPETFSTAPASSNCPNEQLRSENGSLALPDCRAYELVSPPSKGAVDIDTLPQGVGGVPAWASADGNHVIMLTGAPLPGSGAGNIYQPLAGTRTAAGWTDTILTTQGDSPAIASSEDFSHQIYVTLDPAHPEDNTPAAPNVFLRNPDGSFDQISPITNDPTENRVPYRGASADFSHIVFRSCQSLLPGVPTNLCAEEKTELYEWNRGVLSIVGILPDGSVAPGGADAGAGIQSRSVVSTDGSSIIFESPSNTNGAAAPGSQIYLRSNGATLEVSTSRRFPPDPNGPQTPAFLAASADGSMIFFQSNEELTSNANTSGDVAPDLYAYDANTRSLTDLTAAAPGGGQFQGLLGMSAHGSRAYFVARGVLPGTAAIAGEPNLYRWDRGGTTTFLATLSGGDDLGAGVSNDTRAEVTPDGNHLLFLSQANLTAYNSNGYREAYLYDAHTNAITCLSCDPGGAPPTNDTSLPVARSPLDPLPRAISANGSRAFFQTAEPLVPRASDNRQNVYEYDNGQLSLISSGTSSDNSTLISSSASGNDVFFATRDRLAPQDTDNNTDVYDARVGGGFPYTPPNLGCTGDACQGQPGSPPLFGAPASIPFSGSGNLVPLTRAQKLTRALKACRAKHNRRKRAACEAQAREKYGATHKAKKAHRRGK